MDKKQNITIDSIYLEITDKCNLNCSYCCRNCNASRHNFMELSIIKKLLEDASKIGATGIAVSGGEPLLHPEFEEILSISRDLNYSFTILTNGVMLSKLNDSLLLSIEKIQISLDGGTSETNDLTRGIGSYDKVIKSIKNIISRGYSSSNISLKMTITGKNYLEVKALADIADSLGINIIGYSFIFEEGRAKDADKSLYLSGQKKIQVMNMLHEIMVKYPKMMISPPGYTEICPLTKKSDVALSPRIDVNYNVYACQMFEENYSIGNLKKDNIIKIVNSDMFTALQELIINRNSFMAECKNCFMKTKCLRGCAGIALHTNNLFNTDGMCDLRKNHLKEYLKYKIGKI